MGSRLTPAALSAWRTDADTGVMRAPQPLGGDRLDPSDIPFESGVGKHQDRSGVGDARYPETARAVALNDLPTARVDRRQLHGIRTYARGLRWRAVPSCWPVALPYPRPPPRARCRRRRVPAGCSRATAPR